MTIVVVNPIPLDVPPERLAAEAGLTVERAAATLESALPRLGPVGCFDEVAAGVFRDSLKTPPQGSPPLIIGLCTLGSGGWDPPDPTPGWTALKRMAVRDALDFLEYRIRLFLKPTGRAPGIRLAPGCSELKITANQTILHHFPAEYVPGLTVDSSGELSGPGIAFLYLPANAAADAGRCAGCNRSGCLARQPV